MTHDSMPHCEAHASTQQHFPPQHTLSQFHQCRRSSGKSESNLSCVPMHAAMSLPSALAKPTPLVAGFHLPAPRQRINHICYSNKRSDESVSNLDSLLGGSPPPPPVLGTSPADGQQEQQVQQQEKPQVSEEQAKGWYWWERPAGNQTNPLRRRGMEAGSSGSYLDPERLTRDPLQLEVGQRTAADGSTPLPLPGDTARPLVSWAAAAAVAAGGALTLSGLLPDYGMDSEDVALGDWWRLWVASLQPLSWADLAASVAALLSAGAYAERRLGGSLYATALLAAGTCASLLWYAASLVFVDGTVHAGAGPALLGPAAALAIFAATNWRVLSARQRLECAAAVVGCAAVLAAEPGWVGVEGAAPSAASGLLLAALAGPRLEVLRELDIGEGSMEISGEEAELLVVVDKLPRLRRWLCCAALLLAVWGAAALVDSAVVLDQVLRLAALLEVYGSDPEVQQLLYEAVPDAFPTA